MNNIQFNQLSALEKKQKGTQEKVHKLSTHVKELEDENKRLLLDLQNKRVVSNRVIRAKTMRLRTVCLNIGTLRR